MNRLFLVVPLALCASIRPSAAQERVEVFRGRSESRPQTVSAAETDLLRRLVLPEARRLWSGAAGCEEDFRAVDAAGGAFTARGAAQRAVLYRFCETGHDFAKGGIAVLQGGRLVAHVVIDGPEPDGLQALPDIDRNGRAELLLEDGATHQGVTERSVAIIQLTAGGVRKLGMYGVGRDDSGAASPLRSETVETLSVIPGSRPRFYAESLISREGNRARWVGLEKLHPVTLAPDPTTYRRLR